MKKLIALLLSVMFVASACMPAELSDAAQTDIKNENFSLQADQEALNQAQAEREAREAAELKQQESHPDSG